MGKLRRLWDSPRQFKWLLAEAAMRFGVASVGRYLPRSHGTRSLIQGHPIAARVRATAPSSENICRAVETASRFVPGATCLVKAQVASAMLNRFGYPAEIRLGVLKNSSKIEAHAWVECGGTIVMGEDGNVYAELQKNLAIP